MKKSIITLILVIILIIAVSAFFSIKGLIKPSSSIPPSGYLSPASALSALISNSNGIYNGAGNFRLSYKMYFVNTSDGQNETGNYSFESYKGSFNLSAYSIEKLSSSLDQIEYAHYSFNNTEIYQCFRTYFANTTAVNSTAMAQISKINGNLTQKCFTSTVPSNISQFDAAYVVNTFPLISFTPIANYIVNPMSPEEIFRNSTVKLLGTRKYLGQSCDLYNITAEKYPENVTFIDCISESVGLPISSIEEADSQIIFSTNLSSFYRLS